MLFDYCRAQADTAPGDVVPMDLSRLGKGKGKKGKGDNKGKGDKKGQRQRQLPKRPSTFLGTVLSARPGGMR